MDLEQAVKLAEDYVHERFKNAVNLLKKDSNWRKSVCIAPNTIQICAVHSHTYISTSTYTHTRVQLSGILYDYPIMYV